MRYIGVRTSKCPPTEDTSYWGSSKHLPDNISTTHVKIILKLHASRKDAVAHEVLMHRLNSVATNPIFYNKANQLTTGFDTSGVPMSEDTKSKIAATLKGRKITPEHQAKITEKLKGRVFSDEHKHNLSLAHLKYCARDGYVNPRKGIVVSKESRKKNSDTRPAYIKAPRFSPWFIIENGITYLFHTITKQEYALSKGVKPSTYRELATRSCGIRPMARGKYKGIIVGNLPTQV